MLDLTLAPIGVMQWAAHELAEGCGVMVSGGRSAASLDGFKAMLGGAPLVAADRQQLQQRMTLPELLTGSGDFDREPQLDAYVDHLASRIQLARPIKLVIDHGNGAAAVVGADLLKRPGCSVHEIWPQVDGNFPNHFPDPTSPDSLVDVISVQRSSAQGELGIVFSGDGAGLALLAGDLAGHFYFADGAQGHDDALYATARLALALSRHPDMAAAAAALAALPKVQSPAEIRMKAGPQTVNDLLQDLAPLPFDGGKVRRLEGAATTSGLEGLRIVWADGLRVIRASTTSAGLALRFEGATPATLQQAQTRFKAAFAVVRPGVNLPF